MHFLLAAPAMGSELLTEPWIFGPAIGFVVMLLILAIRAFIREDIVPGKHAQRLQAENARLSQLVEVIIPLTERMTAAVEKNTETLNDVLDLIDDDARHRARNRRP